MTPTTVCAAPTATTNRANCLFSGVTNVGAYTGSASPYGTYDQGGNVWEWNEQIIFGSFRNTRGGAWDNYSGWLAASGYQYMGPTYEDDFIGFRVASPIPEPGTALLVMTGLLGLAYRERRQGRAG